MPQPRTLFDKIWDSHVIAPQGEGTYLIYIDLHLIHEVTTPQAFDPAAQAASAATVADFAASSISWLQEGRKSAGADSDYQSTLKDRASDALSKSTGVNLDEEMTLLLELERSYQASTRLVSAINNMLGTLLQAVG